MPAFNVGPGRARLDEQIYNLPLSFRSQTLNTIRYTGLNLGVAGVPFIAAATVSVAAVPEPASSVLMLFGLACCSVACRRRSAR